MKAFFATLIIMLGILTAAWIVEGIAMLAANWPILLIIAAVALLAAGIYLLVKHWKTVWNWIKEIAMAVWRWLVDAWNATWKGIMVVVHWIKKEIIDPIIRYFEFLLSIWKAVWHGIQAYVSFVFNNIVKPVIRFFEALWHGIVAVFNWIIGFFRKWWALLLELFLPGVFAILAIWHSFHTAITNAIRAAWAFIQTIFKTAWEGIKAAAVAIWHGIYDFIVEPIEKAWQKIVAFWGMIQEAFKTAWKDIKAAAVAIWHGIYDSIVNPIEKAYNWIQKKLDGIGKAVRDAFNGVLDWLKGLWDKWTKVGEDVIKGIIKGLEGMAGKLWDKVTGIANRMLKVAQDAIGAKSPSTLFADEVGKMIPLGIALGITQAAPVVNDALGSVMGGTTRAAPSMLAGGVPLGRALMAGAGGGAPLLVQINLDGRKVGDALVTSQQRFKGRNNSTFLT
jgi:phage-related protein